MARILLTWELGAGFGHLTRLRPIVDHLAAYGHEIHLAVRNLSSVETVFADADVALYQAPITVGRSPRHIRCPAAFSHILHNCGFSNQSELRPRVKAWNRLFETIAPDMLVCDHSPTALAARAAAALRRSSSVQDSCVRRTSGRCRRCNRGIPRLQPFFSAKKITRWRSSTMRFAANDKPVIDHLSQLYHDTDLTLLTTFKEFDHFGERPGIRYFGAWPRFCGETPDWPSAEGPRVFAYLKWSSHVVPLLDELKRLKLPAIVFGTWVTEAVAEQHGNGTLHLATRPLDLKRVAEECDLAILNGTHGATSAMLLGGTPTLQLPIFLEQHLLAHRLAGFGAAAVADCEDSSSIIAGLKQMLATNQFTVAAKRFSAIYSRVDPDRQFELMMERITSLLQDQAVEQVPAALNHSIC